ncbi:OmpA family protein [Thioclava sp. GXIMD4216]|uniref:OmpA family protein n=1 Tax=Thioclava litoralis TaxID=3076557 RepID=A0ABZ1DXK4_9RHOB|nr:OmpA family protein [Thioclava sp. FTW29]
MNKKISLTVASVALLAMAGCVTTPADPNDPYQNTRGGAIAGALLGGAAGAMSGGDERLTKAAAGAAVGGLIGGAIGNQMDKQAQELRRDLDAQGTSVVRDGNNLVVTMPQDILFATDSSAVRPDLQNDLYTLAGSMNRYPNTTLQVVGNTDNTGEAAYNQRLSEARANAVTAVLVQAGVPSSRIQSYGRGEENPIASNLTAEGRAKNRRVEFIITPTNAN